MVFAVGPPDGPAQPRQHPQPCRSICTSPRTDGSRGTARFRRFHLGRNGAAHGGAVAHLFDSLLGFTAFKLSGSKAQRTAFLHVDYRKIVLIGEELQVDAVIDDIVDRKIFVSGRLLDGDAGAGRGALAVRQTQAGAAVSEDTGLRGLTHKWARWRDRLRATPRPRPRLPHRGRRRRVCWCWSSASWPSRTPAPAGRSCSSAWRSWPPSSNGRTGCCAYVRKRYDAVMDWFKEQGLWVQALGVLFTCRRRGRRPCGCSERWLRRRDCSGSNTAGWIAPLVSGREPPHPDSMVAVDPARTHLTPIWRTQR